MKYIFVLLGFVFTIIGLIGVVIPVMPTVPFLLVAGICFAKGSERFHRRFIQSKIYKKYVEDYVNTKAMTLSTKIRILATASTMLIIAFIFANNLHARIFIGFVIVVKYYYFIFKIETIDQKSMATKLLEKQD